jgi:hypothetical protein
LYAHNKSAGACGNIADAGLAGQQAVVTDAVKALWQHMHQEAAEELVAIVSRP